MSALVSRRREYVDELARIDWSYPRKLKFYEDIKFHLDMIALEMEESFDSTTGSKVFRLRSQGRLIPPEVDREITKIFKEWADEMNITIKYLGVTVCIDRSIIFDFRYEVKDE